MLPDAFDVLGIAPGFDLEISKVESAFLGFAAAIHPDMTSGDEDAARRMAAMNEARRVLSNPELRADVLLRRLGGPAADQERGLPAGFLGEVMSVREEIDDAMREVGDSRERQRKKWAAWSAVKRTEAVKEVSEMFRSLPNDGPARVQALRAIRVRLNAWRYIERLIEQLDPAYNAKAGM